MSRAPRMHRPRTHGVSTSSCVAVSTFSHMHQHHNPNSITHSASTRGGGARSEDVYTEENSVALITPLPGARFDLSGAPPPPSKDKAKGTVGDAYADSKATTASSMRTGRSRSRTTGSTLTPPAPASVAKKGSKGKSKKAAPVPSGHHELAEDGSEAGTPSSPRERERVDATVSPPTAGVNARANVGGQWMHPLAPSLKNRPQSTSSRSSLRRPLAGRNAQRSTMPRTRALAPAAALLPLYRSLSVASRPAMNARLHHIRETPPLSPVAHPCPAHARPPSYTTHPTACAVQPVPAVYCAQ
ncbi:hypothetical protein GGX14DRAFT_210200 [Mycena pura]|uniref:Uncharacterized protein n=1 Tax=Mycena pura TaxID=153505 RepID=A0AAD6UTG2_9AGAR|nr:hypothetical protein GGX14DRAFT_210200 [Mycena pura]